MSRPALQHGVDGWVLEDMEWNSRTGIASFIYSRDVNGVREEREELVAQPYRQSHVDWHARPRDQRSLSINA